MCRLKCGNATPIQFSLNASGKAVSFFSFPNTLCPKNLLIYCLTLNLYEQSLGSVHVSSLMLMLSGSSFSTDWRDEFDSKCDSMEWKNYLNWGNTVSDNEKTS